MDEWEEDYIPSLIARGSWAYSELLRSPNIREFRSLSDGFCSWIPDLSFKAPFRIENWNSDSSIED